MPSPFSNTGFTISGLRDLLPVDANTIGWIFEFPNVRNHPSEDKAKIKDIRINELRLPFVPSINILTLPIEVGSSQEIVVPCKMVHQNNPNGGQYDMSYQQAKAYLETKLVYDDGTNGINDLPIDSLDGYERWAERAFIGRESLDLLNAFINQAESPCNDLFFSGAKSDYIDMNSPKLKVQQKNYFSQRTNANVPDTSKAFTLKVEPIENDQANSTQSGAQTVSFIGSGSLPVAALMAPCPDYWDYMQGIQSAIYATVPWLSWEDSFTIKEFLAAQGFNGTNTVSIPLGSLNLDPTTQTPEEKDFFDRLRDLWNSFVALVEGS